MRHQATIQALCSQAASMNQSGIALSGTNSSKNQSLCPFRMVKRPVWSQRTQDIEE